MKNTSIKALAIAAAAVFTFNSGFAQESTTPVCKTHEVTVGARGGINMSMLFAGNKDINKNYDFGLGYNVGMTGSYAINRNFGIVAEVNFAKLSCERHNVQPIMPGSALQTTSYQLYANYKRKENFDYIEVPVMFRATTAGKAFKVFANAGPYIAMLTAGTIESTGRSMIYKDLAGQVVEGASTVYTFDGNQTVTSQLATVYMGLAGGLGCGYTFGKHTITIDARYNVGVTNIRTNESINGKNNLTTLGAAVGYNYAIFK